MSSSGENDRSRGSDQDIPNVAVTLRIDCSPRTGQENAFDQGLDGMLDAASRSPGYVGVRVIRPSRGTRGYRVLLRFESRVSLQAWVDSDEHDTWLSRLDEHSERNGHVSVITGTVQERPIAVALAPIDRFVRSNVSGIGLLLLGTALALILANTPLADTYEHIWNTTLSVTASDYQVSETLRNWINDGLMALFFFIVGLEIKRQVLVGEMQHPPLAWLAVAAALGGVIFPALVYYGVNTVWNGEPGGWGIPVGTDTAFALGLLSIFGHRVQPTLVAFVTAFSIVDDILAVLVIAIFYTESINWYALGIAAVLLIALGVANAAGFQRWPVYAFLGLGVWIGVYESGVHSTLAGVLVAMVIPARAWIHPTEFIDRGQQIMDEFKDAARPGSTTLSNQALEQATNRLEELTKEVETPMDHLQHLLNPWVYFVILPLFAFANAGIPLIEGIGISLRSPVTWGVVAGLLIGKPLGITLVSWLAVRIGLAALPEHVSWKHIGGVALIGGIGFTMSLFVTGLAFPPGPIADAARIGMLIASVIAGIVAWFYLNQTLPATDSAEGES